jgi:hypothetical protein
MEKVLYDERKDLANQEIIDRKYDAARMTELIAAFNALPVVKPITTAAEAKKFLQGPTNYLDERILQDCGVSFQTGARPKARIIGEMFEIPYSAFVEKVQYMKVRSGRLELYTFDEATKKVELNPEAEATIREDCKIYIEPGRDTEEFNKIQSLADTFNEMAPMYNIDGTDLHRAIGAFRFFRTVVKPGGGWQLAPNVDEIKKALARVSNNK